MTPGGHVFATCAVYDRFPGRNADEGGVSVADALYIEPERVPDGPPQQGTAR